MTAETPSGDAAHPILDAFRAHDRPMPTMRTLRKSTLVATEVLSDHRNLVVSGTLPQDDAYIVTLHLRARPKGAMAAEGRRIRPENFAAGNAGIVDLRTRLVSEYAGPFHYLSFYLTRAALDAVTDDDGCRRISALRHRPGIGFSDPVVRHLLLSLQPALAVGPAETTALYADHVARAFVSHMASAYGDLRSPRLLPRRGLAAWQERRAKELLEANLDGGVPLADLAAACELSVRQFTRAFRQSTGQSPHRWLVERRLEKAQGLLELSTRPLADIAAACGFANQSHFTRAFGGALGMSPGAWRRERRR
ncbi:helix-turn-helix domain-containing protein [Nannocystis radixulma]|uniref:Helix-turn-helix domain-containing protein n=1 Tax=Nannocystis radixulma TaxID=2995305 RepID=A0ABT5B2A9_9BACT|nr:helix-turn-helix domain-containing protein [Nannocystis radixulma]MDC0667810.1 helix-turn-helix domain-containing protein [Nannocystis radixulma]